MLNYDVEPSLLSRHVPPGTSLDSFQGRTYVSLVGFRFCRTKLLGHFPVPFHANFDEVNLRFYVGGKKAAKTEEELFSSPRWCPDVRLQPSPAFFTARITVAFR